MKLYQEGERIIDRAWKHPGRIVKLPIRNYGPLSRVTVAWDNGTVSEAWYPSLMPETEWRVKMGELKVPKLGARVKVKSIGIKGTIFHIDSQYLFRDHFLPIQVTLDRPYKDKDSGTETTMYRTSLPDIKILKKKQEEPEEELLILDDDDDELLILEDGDDDLIILDDDEDEPPVKKEKRKKKKKKV